MHNPILIANYFLTKSFQTGKEITPMKLVKLVYIAHGWHLGLYNSPLINEPVQAWKYGTVIGSVYHAFKDYSNDPITQYAPIPDQESLSPGLKQFLDRIWEVYSKFDGLQLSTMTHQPNTPWDIVWNKEGGKAKRAVIIGTDVITEHYKSKMNDNAAAESAAI